LFGADPIATISQPLLTGEPQLLGRLPVHPPG